MEQQQHGLLEVGSEADLAAGQQPTRHSRSITSGVLTVACLAAIGCVIFVCREQQRGPRPSPIAAQSSDAFVELTLLENPAKNLSSKSVHKNCSWGQGNCNATRCCNNPGMQCYQQNSFYAQCRESCTPGPDPTHWDGLDWDCKVLGARAAGSSKCSAAGEDCSQSTCCLEANTRCFKKGPGWAACKTECWPWAPDTSDSDEHFWTCDKLGSLAPGASPWVAELCSADGEDCRTTRCCKSPGKQCYTQSDDWADCRSECSPGKDPARSWEPAWGCEELGTRTPAGGAPPPAKVASWVPEKCAWDATDCKGSRCCIGMNKQCFAKNDDYATCLESCQPGRHPEDNNETWSCAQLSPRSKGLAIKGTPSLWCWSLFQPDSYEMGIMQNQLKQGIGIFDCDGFVTLSTSEPTYIGKTPDSIKVTSLHVSDGGDHYVCRRYRRECGALH